MIYDPVADYDDIFLGECARRDTFDLGKWQRGYRFIPIYNLSIKLRVIFINMTLHCFREIISCYIGILDDDKSYAKMKMMKASGVHYASDGAESGGVLNRIGPRRIPALFSVGRSLESP